MSTGLRVPWSVRRRELTAAVTVVALIVATVVAGVLLVLLAPLNPPPQVGTSFAVAAVQLVLAVLIIRTSPGDVTAVLLAALGLVIVVANSLDLTELPALEGSWMLLYLPVALLLLVAPTGHPASPRWRALAVAICAVVAVFLSVTAAQHLWPPAADTLAVIGLPVLVTFFGLLIACAIAPFARYRRADDRVRMQLRWVLGAGLSLPLTLLLCWASYLALGGPDLVVFGLVIMLLTVPVGATIAIVDPQLFDVDRAVVAAVTVLALASAVLAVLSIAGLAAGRPLAQWSPMIASGAAIAATLAAVVAFPFAQRGFNRMLYPQRSRAVAALRRLSAAIDTGTAQPEQIQTVLREALRDPELVVAYRRLADRALIGMDGRPATLGPIAATVHARGDDIGAIIPSAGHVKRPAVAIAREASAVLDVVRARAELAAAAAEIDASRERMLRAGYDERRRLERDLHDGAQQRLVALGMRLRVLQRAAAADSALASSLDTAVAELGTAVAELRQLAHGVRPSALDDGLAAALAAVGRLSPETIELDVRAGDLPDAVATTAYFVVNEAVSNALRHAGAARIGVLVRQSDDTVQVRVSDDGRGGATACPSGGLTGLSDRVRAIGGELRVTSPIGEGTVIEAVLPCAS